MNPKISDVHTEISRLRMVVATDSAMLLAVLRLLQPKQLAAVSQDFLQACEGLNTRSLYSELDDATVQEAQARRDWWIGLMAELVAENAGLPGDQAVPTPGTAP
jgi:phosphotransferase system IIB component